MKAFCFEVFGPIWAQLEPRMRFFKFCVKSMHGTFLNLQHHKGLKLTQMIFLWENLALWSLNKKLSRMSFLSFITNQCIELSWFFAWSRSSMKAENSVKVVLAKFLFWDFWGKMAQVVLKLGFLSLWEIQAWYVSNFLYKFYIRIKLL